MKHRYEVDVYIDEEKQVFWLISDDGPFEGFSSIEGIPFNHPKAKKLLIQHRKQQRLREGTNSRAK